MKRILLTATLVSWGLATAIGAEADRQAADKAAIRKAVEAYVAAFNRADAKALTALWSPEAVYTNPLSGEQVVGREAIERQAHHGNGHQQSDSRHGAGFGAFCRWSDAAMADGASGRTSGSAVAAQLVCATGIDASKFTPGRTTP